MKLKLSILFIISAFLLIPKISLAESIQDFKSQITINANSTILVVESIVYDFGTTQHHGIYRDIPYSYQANGGNYTIGITVNTVSDENGQHYKYSVSKSSGQIHIKIGDPDFTIAGVHTYIISYNVAGAINFFSDHNELYWNVTGSGWTVPIGSSSASVILPASVAVTELKKTCFAGEPGTTAACSSIMSGLGDSTFEVNFNQDQLTPGQGLTIVVGFPKDLVKPPGWFEKFVKLVQDNWGLALPFVVFIFMWYLWNAKGKDPAGFSTIVAQYDAPKDITPIEAGIIIDGTADNSDVSAELIYLATLGYLKITKLEHKVLGIFNSTDYEFEQLKDYKDLPNEFDRQMMSGLFGLEKKKKLSSLKNHFFVDLKKVRDSAYQAVVLKGHFTENPKTVKALYIGIASFLAFGSIFIGSATQNVYIFIGILISAAIIGIFGYFMPRHTIKGAQAKQYILGLKLYLSVAEKDRLKFFNSPEKSPQLFEKLLPYAIALGVDQEWAGQFQDIYKQPPSWYNDSFGGNFNSYIFVNSLHNFSSSANTTFASAPSGSSGGAWGGGSGFGGGGLGGGGFGGGGGGSW